jgi:amino acid transporter
MSLSNLLLGRRLASNEKSQQKIGALAGLPIFGLDGLASSAYGPEAALTILLPLGAAGLHLIEPITLAILGLLALLSISYCQTIAAYPNAGGSYAVTKDNLGVNLSLLAGTALLIDYILNVAVGISAGVGALVSAVPTLYPHTLALCLAILAAITLTNLRGTSESAWLFGPPTYLFVGSFAVLMTIGIVRVTLSGGHPQPIVPPPSLHTPTAAIGLWVVLRAFASGCTAMTGVEAVSNGVSAFREPAVQHAHRTLIAIVAILAALLGGIAYLSRSYGIGAMEQTQPGYQSVLSQLAAALVGHGVFYYVAIGSVLMVLCLSANTSFADLPRLCSMIAKDRFLPISFATVGRRLVFSVGIVFLAGTAGLLLILFGGITDRLIPLFAVGAFLAFTLSQAGMVMHWYKRLADKDGRWVRAKLIVNGLGATATGVALIIILIAKLREGAWITVAAMPVLIGLFKLVHRYYERIEYETRSYRSLDLSSNKAPVVLIPTDGWNRLTEKALRFGMRLSPEVIAIHLSAVADTGENAREEEFRRHWQHYVGKPAAQFGLRPPKLYTIRSKYRTFVPPLLDYIGQVFKSFPDREVSIIIPELIKSHWWEYLLHNHRARRLKAALLRHGGPRLLIVSIPWYLEPSAESIEETSPNAVERAGAHKAS